MEGSSHSSIGTLSNSVQELIVVALGCRWNTKSIPEPFKSRNLYTPISNFGKGFDLREDII